MEQVTLQCGDSLDLLKALDDCSIDSIVTDPPYELSFMGRKWDGSGIAHNVSLWQECLRVAKPGAHLLAFGGTRTFHRMMCAIEDAGWEIRDTVMWVYGSGMPKSLSVGKAIDKAGGGCGLPENDRIRFAQELRDKRKAAGVSRNELANWFPQYAEVTKNWERVDGGFRVPSEVDFDILVRRLGISETWRLRVRAEDKRRLLTDDGTDRRGDGTVFGLGHNGKSWEVTTDAAKQWDGWGTGLKPAWEPIVVARKPLDGTVAANVQKYGTGAMNIDGCRVPTEDVTGRKVYQTQSWKNTSTAGVGSVTDDWKKGRWPANLIHDGSDEAVDGFPQAQGNSNKSLRENTAGFGGRIPTMVGMSRADSGSAARFFYCAKASSSDRGEGNTHPTVKPMTLMRYLVKLVTQPNGVVLDPFMGSGSTGCAAVLEGCQFIGFDLTEEYVEIARKRIAKSAAESVPEASLFD